jgi:hypothetical protein
MRTATIMRVLRTSITTILVTSLAIPSFMIVLGLYFKAYLELRSVECVVEVHEGETRWDPDQDPTGWCRWFNETNY